MKFNKDITLEQRLQRAADLHSKGYSCSQCMVMAFDDVEDYNPILVAASAPFGRGVGGLQQICGVVSGFSMLEGLRVYGNPSDKAVLFENVKHLAGEYQNLNGSCICGELLSSRKKSCRMLIEDGVTIFHRYIHGL